MCDCVCVTVFMRFGVWPVGLYGKSVLLSLSCYVMVNGLMVKWFCGCLCMRGRDMCVCVYVCVWDQSHLGSISLTRVVLTGRRP